MLSSPAFSSSCFSQLWPKMIIPQILPKAQTPSEVSLPPMDLSKSEKQQQGHSQSEALNISLKLNQNKLIIYLDDKAMNLAQFKKELLQLKSIAQVNLRRDRDIPISFEDDVILACQAAGIHQVSIVMEI